MRPYLSRDRKGADTNEVRETTMMNRQAFRLAKPVLITTAVATAIWVSAGDLNPPAGPIAPTQRTPIGASTTPGDNDGTPSLYKITQPGSYYLTGNITGVSAKYGIEIAASGVTLDLMGFDLLGVPGSLDGIRVTVAPTTDIAVFNGSVRNWGGMGVFLSNTNNIRVADLRVSGNGSDGINTGTNAVITNCSAYDNTGGGIHAGSSCTITNCSAYGNRSGQGFTGTGVFVNCTALANTGNGFSIGSESLITNCSATSNTGDGIYAASGSTITNCSAGINFGDGIESSNGSTITNCSVHGNRGDGIRVVGECTVHGNTCRANGLAGDSAGIHVIGNLNRIEGNHCTYNDRGIDVDDTLNFITRNTCRSNTTNWDVVAGNVCLVVAATTSAAIVGDSGGVAPGSTDPNANFTY